MIERFAQAFMTANSASPCNGCKLERKCAAQSLACPDFFYFVNTPMDARKTQAAQSSRITSRGIEAARWENKRNVYAKEIAKNNARLGTLREHLDQCAAALAGLPESSGAHVSMAEYVRDSAAKKLQRYEADLPVLNAGVEAKLDATIARLLEIYAAIETDENNLEAIRRIGSAEPCVRRPDRQNYEEIFKRDPACTSVCGWDCGNEHKAE